MVTRIIEACLRRSWLILTTFILLMCFGYKALISTPIDAIPDLSDVQVIVKVNYPGQAPDLVEQQVTYPLSTLLMSVPGSEIVRGFSFFGDAYLYVIFAEHTDLYWARARVLEYLNQAQQLLPEGASIQIGPDASGVGWVYQYVIHDKTGEHNLADLTRLQDWFIRQELQSVSGVSEVAKIGGMVQTYQVVLDPLKLLQYQLTLKEVYAALKAANSEVGGSVVELAEAEYMVRSKGYLSSLDEFADIPLGIVNHVNTPVRLKDIALIRLGPQTRRGVADYNGDGEVVGGIVIMRDGENALSVITRVKQKLEQIKRALPDGVIIETTYDRTKLITQTVKHLSDKLFQEIVIVIAVCGLFLMHARATLVVALSLPIALLLGFLLMRVFGINANLMSLGGIAIAIGAMVDAAIVMVENIQKHQSSGHKEPSQTQRDYHRHLVKKACIEVGPSLFFSLLIITLSFLPIFALGGQAGRLFSPLAYTKTFAMAAAAALSITLIPVLALLLLRGEVVDEDQNLITRFLKRVYRPIVSWTLNWPKLIVAIAIVGGLSALYPLKQMGSEFMLAFDEGDLLYMPTTLPGVSIQEAGQILQQTDRIIKTVPEVDSVFGKVGRADTATDPAPLTMIETTVQLKPKSQWREGYTVDDIIDELENKVQFPGLTNAWVQPIKTRIDMLSTGVKTKVGIKLLGDDLSSIAQATRDIEMRLAELDDTRSVIGERPLSGRYIDIIPDRFAASQYGLSIADIQDVVRMAIGGQTIATSVQQKERFPINMRYPRDYRNNLHALQNLPFVSPTGQWVTLQQVADISISDGASLIRSENARALGWVFIELENNVTISDYVHQLTEVINNVTLPDKVTWSVAGQYQYLQEVIDKLKWVIPATIITIFILLHILFKRLWQCLLILATLPLAVSGALWFVYLLDYKLSVALAVGLIALVGVAAEFGIVMMLYLNSSWESHSGSADDRILYGAVQRVRPKAMTVLTIIAGLLPIMVGAGAGNEVMQRIAAPMLGGMIVCPIISMILIPVAYFHIASRHAASARDKL